MSIEGANNPFETPMSPIVHGDSTSAGVFSRARRFAGDTARGLLSQKSPGDAYRGKRRERAPEREQIPQKYIKVIHAEANAWAKTLSERGWVRDEYSDEVERETYIEAQFRLVTNAKYYRDADSQMGVIFTAKELSESDKMWCVDLFNELVLKQLPTS